MDVISCFLMYWCVFVVCFFFFFQAEDGIRDVERSRGLGDVYKRQPYLSSRIIIRDLIGKHAWLITEHRVLDYNCIDTIDYNDQAAVYKNLLNLKGDQKLKDLITENKGVSESSKSSEEEKLSLIHI
eukprot:TRINITY_DN39674_c0_g1_i2.p3 TRINITY_DN39674_c0_g1~~TRINITY_DN39674_c0_g1_i2.p3  ORF type:complete len:127 (-),score=29.73 TRINITY_DN39674_c0_g1_i2:56-436(-)